MTKRVIEREQSIMGRIFFIFKVNTVEKVLRDLFQQDTRLKYKIQDFLLPVESWHRRSPRRSSQFRCANIDACHACTTGPSGDS